MIDFHEKFVVWQPRNMIQWICKMRGQEGGRERNINYLKRNVSL